MAHFFFNLRFEPGPNGVAADPEGDEIADAGHVREHALAKARDLVARTRLDSIPDWFACAFEVTDEQGRAVMTVPFADVVPEDESNGS